MKLLFLDDSIQKDPTRERMGQMVAIGGLIIDDLAARMLENAINEICLKYGFPPREPFKWSPNGDYWMRNNLIAEKRNAFFREVLEKTKELGGSGLVCSADSKKNLAIRSSKSHEHDVLLLTLERFHSILRSQNQIGMVIIARPSGDRKAENSFLKKCSHLLSIGTDYEKFNLLATPLLTIPFPHSRLLQISDLIVSITNAMIAGHINYAGEVFPQVKALLHSVDKRIGGIGVKIHPSYSYLNLYHWVLGDTVYWKMRSGFDLPLPAYPYSTDPFIYTATPPNSNNPK